jgi:putative membrane protein
MSAPHCEGREMIRKSIVLAALLSVGLAPAAAGATPRAQASSPQAQTESAQDAGFLQAVHQANLAEIAAGGIARERGVSPRVRALGTRFIRDHRAIDARLTATARAAGVILPDTPTAAQLALTRKYQAVADAKFDGLYLRTQLAAHNAALQAGKTELAQGDDARVKKLVAYAAPLVMAHHAALVAALRSYGHKARHR